MIQKNDQNTRRRSFLKYGGLTLIGGLFGNLISNKKVYAGSELAHAMWVHGHSMQVEYEDRIVDHQRKGFFSRVQGKPNTSNWFHFAIPTPVIVDGRRLRALSVMLNCRTQSSQAVIRSVHIYDGQDNIGRHDKKRIYGDVRARRFNIPDAPRVRWGIGISIGVEFGEDPNSNNMDFYAAGCDFNY